MNEIKKRVFFALEVHAPWPENLPKGHLLDPEDRHATLAFLGDVTIAPLQQYLDNQFPSPPFKVGFAGTFSKCLFLPPRHPNVVAWDVDWLDNNQPLAEYRETFLKWLKVQNYHPKEHEGPWLCHVTMARQPFDWDGWKKTFKPLPMTIHAIHLYESLGHSKYKPIWSYPLIPPFQEIEHTADIAFLVNGENASQIHRHAQTALAFRFPALIPFMNQNKFENLEDIILNLNDIIAKADATIGCPFKAISYHGQLQEKDSILQWEMIVDV